MGALFRSASQEWLEHPSLPSYLPTTGYPCTMGCWLMPNTSGASQFFMGLGTASANNWLGFSLSASLVPQITASLASANTVSLTTAMGINTWNFFLGRFISATSRRLSVYHAQDTSAGLIEHGQATTSKAPTGLNSFGLGLIETSAESAWLDGTLAECWITNTDIVGSDIATPNDLVMQMAFGGPFSRPDVASSVVEYIDLLNWIPPTQRTPDDDVYEKGRASGTDIPWRVGASSLSSGPLLTLHPPLPYWYRRPAPTPRILTI